MLGKMHEGLFYLTIGGCSIAELFSYNLLDC
uniref:Uncharacterized protein n=1 Tax=Rhizophora mucronata TaxID=61149 RepID=A0A2P2QZV9_RHIMU